ncbi:TRAP transporter large permease [Petroclostridium sp. X23]|uniref:TRAP transporter large permease n=1 Tax=Petroclostridium sp. X23 TaxID=3045146 RepID=UPI0024AE5A8E|nr:TRAP transporter large permease [Petroclostridium sp. X23]WHH57022.1 TRAP transporter large permease [Petroclostridium sp. X23]
MISLILFGSFVVFLILNVPIGVALGLSSMVTIFYGGKLNISFMTQSLVTSVDSFPLMAVPFFILAGEIMGRGGISSRLLKTAKLVCGKYTGGLALVTVVTCMFFAAISGSGPATVAAIGGLMVPSMIEKGYNKGFAASIIASAGGIGVIIPPSIPMVIYCVSTGVSISTIFIAGFIPGVLIGVALMIWSWYYAKKNGYTGDSEKYTLKEKWAVVNDAKWSLLVPVIILGGIYGGIFTPTEAAAVAVIYGLVIGVFVYRDIKLPDIADILIKSSLVTATCMIILGTATTFGRLLTVEQIPVKLANAIIAFTDSKIVILLLINILLLFVGCFMETLAAIIILAPILLPVVTAVGVDPVHFGIIMIVNLAIGFITPPLGVNLFVTCGIAKLSLEEISKAIIKPLGILIVVLLLITYIPAISLALPGLLVP